MDNEPIVDNTKPSENPAARSAKPKGKANGKTNGEAWPGLAQAADPFDDLDKLRVTQDRAGSKKRLGVSVGKPGNQAYIRVKPDWSFTSAFIEIEGERRTLYMILPDVLEGLSEEEQRKLRGATMTLRLFVDRDGKVGLWPMRLADSDSGDNSYARSAHVAAELAERRWIRVQADQPGRRYETFEAANQQIQGEPEFPQMTQSEILRAAFKDRLITSLDHLIVKKLRGEVAA